MVNPSLGLNDGLELTLAKVRASRPLSLQEVSVPTRQIEGVIKVAGWLELGRGSRRVTATGQRRPRAHGRDGGIEHVIAVGHCRSEATLSLECGALVSELVVDPLR
jgi:hypothetical protein